MDDNMSTKSVLKHHILESKAKVECKGKEFIWLTMDGKKVPDDGHLPLDLPEPLFLANINH